MWPSMRPLHTNIWLWIWYFVPPAAQVQSTRIWVDYKLCHVFTHSNIDSHTSKMLLGNSACPFYVCIFFINEIRFRTFQFGMRKSRNFLVKIKSIICMNLVWISIYFVTLSKKKMSQTDNRYTEVSVKNGANNMEKIENN